MNIHTYYEHLTKIIFIIKMYKRNIYKKNVVIKNYHIHRQTIIDTFTQTHAQSNKYQNPQKIHIKHKATQQKI